MLNRTHSLTSPWTVVQDDDKSAARVALIHDLLNRLEFERRKVMPAAPSIVCAFAGVDVLAR